jgi:hypothetical protein
MGHESGRAMGMPVAEFIEKTWPHVVSGVDHIIVGAIGLETSFLSAIQQRREQFDILSGHLLSHFEL